MSLDALISTLESLIGQMEYVKSGDYVLAKHTNLFVDWLSNAIQTCKTLYELFKAKTGRTLPDVEGWLSMAENRYSFTRKVKYGDVVLSKDHNLIIDSLKPLELALQKIEENL